MGGLS